MRALRSLKNAQLTFGVVTIPVGVGSTVSSSNEPSFRTLHAECQQPVSMKGVSQNGKEEPEVVDDSGTREQAMAWCDTCDKPARDVVKGYEYVKDQFVVVGQEEIEDAVLPRSSVIQLHKYVKSGEINPRMIDKMYFLIPNPAIGEPYGLLYQGLAKLKAAGIGSQTLWGKEHPCAVIANQEFGVLMLATLHLYEDLTVPDFSSPIPNKKAKRVAENAAMAEQIISSFMEPLNPEADLVSYSRARLLEVIRAKIEGHEVQRASNGDGNQVPPDLQDALRETLRLANERKRVQ